MKSFRCSFKAKELALESHLTAAVVPVLQYQKYIFYGEPYFKPYCKPPGGSETLLKTSNFRYTLGNKAKSSLHGHIQYIKNKLLL